METIRGNTLEYWKQNAEENYITTPISVLKYITILEELNQALSQPMLGDSALCSGCNTKYVVIVQTRRCGMTGSQKNLKLETKS